MAKKKLPDINDIPLPYIVPNKLLMTEGTWNAVHFPASAIAPEAKKLAADPDAIVRVYEGAVADHQDSSGTLVGETRNHTWDGKTLRGDIYFIVMDAARKAKWAVETGHKLAGVSPRMATAPEWKPTDNKITNIVEFKSFGIVLDPAQGDQAMLSKDKKGRPILDDGPIIIMDADLDKEDGVGSTDNGGLKKKEEVIELKKLFCEKCELLFDEGTAKCAKCDATLKEADADTIVRLTTLATERKAAADAETARLKAEADAATQTAVDKAVAAALASAGDPEYPETTYKSKPFAGSRFATYKRPYYGKSGGNFHKAGAVLASSILVRKPAIDEVGDVVELEQDLVGLCGDIVKRAVEKKLDLAVAIMEISALVAEVPEAAELSKVEFDGDEAVLDLITESEKNKALALKAEIDAVEAAGKLPPAARDHVAAILGTRSEATLATDGSEVDVAGHLRAIIVEIKDGAAMKLDNETLVALEHAELNEEKTAEKKREAGKAIVPKNMRNPETE